jgi:predicted RNA-binding protein YlxR (DUF448 family)
VRAEPERTCVGCRARAGKPDLLRVARSPSGEISVDPKGSAPGRGAYVHRDRSCVEAALHRRAFARALRAGPKELEERELSKLRHELEEFLGAP